MNEQQALEKLENITHPDLVDKLTYDKANSILNALEILELPVSENLIQLCTKRVEFLDGNLPRKKTRGYRVRLPRMPMSHTPREKCAMFWKQLPDEVFCSSLEGASSFSEVMKRIPARPSRYNKDHFLARVERLQVDVTHFPSMPPSIIPHEKLAKAVANCSSYTSIVRYLHLPKTPSYRKDLEEYLDEMLYDTSHFPMRWPAVTREQMLDAFEHSHSVSGIAQYLGCVPKGKIGGRTVKNYHKRLKELGLEHPGRTLGTTLPKQYHPSGFFTDPDEYQQ